MNFSTWHGLRLRDPRRLALGTSEWAVPHDAQRLTALLELARTAGLQTIETSRAQPALEEAIGRSGVAAEGWRLLSQLDPNLQHGAGDLAENLNALSKSLSATRRSLGVERVQTVILPRFELRHAQGGRLWRKLLAEREAGQIGALGVATSGPEQAWAALEDPDIEVLQVSASLLDWRLVRHGFFARARELGRTVYVRCFELDGLAQQDPTQLPATLAELAPSLEAIRRMARELGTDSTALFMAFVRDLPGAIALLGCDRAETLAAQLGAWESDRVDAARLVSLVETLPEIPEALLDSAPWRDLGRSVNQTSGASVATLPH